MATLPLRGSGQDVCWPLVFIDREGIGHAVESFGGEDREVETLCGIRQADGWISIGGNGDVDCRVCLEHDRIAGS